MQGDVDDDNDGDVRLDVTVQGTVVPAEITAQQTPASGRTDASASGKSSDSVPPAEFTGVPEGWPERFAFGKLLGSGGTSFVLAASDRELERDVAIKFLRTDTPVDSARFDSFMDEARITAQLEHPNIVPVYDVQQASGLTYLVMRKIRGESLGRMIRRAAQEGRSECMALNDLLTVFLKVCDAVAYAHSRGIVHRDIKPDNVMVGQFGEVMLVDWGAACSATEDDGVFIGTPHYMSPERARSSAATTASDVYALGATLFYALLLRRPLEGESGDRFWQLKIAGEIFPPTERERARLPKALLEIALRALQADAAARQPSAQALADEIRDYQSGRAPWSNAMMVETFDASWLERWCAEAPDQFRVEDGSLVSRAFGAARLLYRKRVTANIAIEFEGLIPHDSRPGDLSIVWTENEAVKDGAANVNWLSGKGRSFALQVGAWSNVFAGIFRNLAEPIDVRRFALEKGREYTVRAEIDERTLRLFVDGELIATHEELFPFSSGFFALYAFFPGKVFRRVRLYVKGFPEKVSPTTVGDEYYKHEDFERALDQYRRVIDAHYGTGLGDEATFKAGLCEFKLGRQEHAERTWQGIKGDLYRGHAELHAIEHTMKHGDHVVACERLRTLYETVPTLRALLRRHWAAEVRRLYEPDTRPAHAWERLERMIALRDALFPDDPETTDSAAIALEHCGRWQEVLDRFPGAFYPQIWSLLCLGRTREVVENFSYVGFVRDEALLRLGRVDQVPADAELYPFALTLQNRLHEALIVPVYGYRQLLLAAGKPELLADSVDKLERPGSLEAMALRRVGRAEEAMARDDVVSLLYGGRVDDAAAKAKSLDEFRRVWTYRAFDAYRSGRRRDYELARAEVRRLPYSWRATNLWFGECFLLPFLEWLDGDKDAMRRTCGTTGTMRDVQSQNPYHFARLIAREIDEREFALQPVQFLLEARESIALALRAELENERELAGAQYRRYLALPSERRTFDMDGDDPVLDHFAAWRASVLGSVE